MKVDYNSYHDALLADLYNQQDQNAYEAIYNRYWDLLYVHAKKMLRNDADRAADAVQEVFVALFKNIGKTPLQENFAGYLYRSIHYQVLNIIKREKVRINYASAIQAMGEPGECTTDHHVQLKELARTIEQELDKLPPKMKAIFEMSRKAYMSHREIAVATQTSEDNVKRQIKQAISRLKRHVGCFFWMQLMLSILWVNRHL